MKAYGYTKGVKQNKYGYSEISEIAISASPEHLREISSFLQKAAKDMEAKGEKFNHAHLQDQSEHWVNSWFDIIVCKEDKSSN